LFSFFNIYSKIKPLQFKKNAGINTFEIYNRDALENYKTQWIEKNSKETVSFIKKIIFKADSVLKSNFLKKTVIKYINDKKHASNDMNFIFNNAATLILAWFFTDNEKYAEYAVKIIRTIFINPEFRMNTFFQSAEYIKKKKKSDILFKTNGIYFFLDTILLIKSSKHWSDVDHKGMILWCNKYLNSILNQGKIHKEKNYKGTFYDIQVIILAVFVGKFELAWWFFINTQTKLTDQFRKNGEQTLELETENIKYYCALNLQGWLIILKLGKALGINFFEKREDRLKLGFKWFLHFSEIPWPFSQTSDFDEEIFFYLYHFVEQNYPELIKNIRTKNILKMKTEFHPNYCINPFWQLGFKK